MTRSTALQAPRARRTSFTALFRGAPCAALLCGLVAGCGGGPTPGADANTPADAAQDNVVVPTGLPVLGRGTHVSSSVSVREIGTAADGLAAPRDLAFNPEAPEQLWVVNFGSDSVTIYRDPGAPTQMAETRAGFGNTHFLSQPAALAFGAPSNMATAQEQDEPTQSSTPADFMGPTLWDTNLDIFDAGHASHLDMLHNSPNGVGIAWERANIYWLVGGSHRALMRYDFGAPHEHGGEDHSDGTVERFAAGELGYVPNVSSGVEFDMTTGRVYVADSGNARIAVLDPSTAVRGRTFGPNYDGGSRFLMTGASLTTFVEGSAHGMERPSGLALVGDTFYVTDNANSKVFAFNRAGELLDWVDLSDRIPPGSLNGIAVDARGSLYLADATGNRIFVVAPMTTNSP